MGRNETKHGIFIIDKNFNIISINGAFKNLYPNARIGSLCYKSCFDFDAPCPTCRVNSGKKSSCVMFNPGKNMWVNSFFEEIELKDYGTCYSFNVIQLEDDDYGAEPFGEIEEDVLINNHHLLETSNLWKTALNNLPNGYFRCLDDENFTLLFFSDRLCEILGYTREEIKRLFNNQIISMVHPDDRKKFDSITFHLRNKNTKKNYCEEIYRLKGKNGYIWVLDSVKRYPFRDSFIFQGTFTDITNLINKQQRTNENLLNTQNRVDQYRKALISDADAIYEINITKKTLEKAAFYRGDEETSMADFWDIEIPCPYSVFISKLTKNISEEDVDLFIKENQLDYFLECFNKNRLKWQSEYGFCVGDGKYIRIEKHYVLTQNEYNGEIHALIVAKDITAEEKAKEENAHRLNMQKIQLQKALEKAQKAEKAKTTFLLNMSHDIRTPMNAIIGFNTLARKNIDKKEKALDALKKSEMASEHLLNLINDVLEMSRIESGKIKLNEQVVSVRDNFEEIRSMFEQSMEEQKIAFISDLHMTEPYICVDGTRVTQVITNLLSNAMKFTRPGGTVWYITKETSKNKKGEIFYQVNVKDNGIGISKKFQKHLFETFEREQNSTVSNITGTGLGLSIAKNIATLLDGDLTFTSTQGKGTEFIFTFKGKIASPEENIGKITTEKNTALKDRFTNYRLLLVEDNALNREIATEIVAEYGFKIETAENGAIAVDMVKKSEPGYYDLILMDIQMPVMDGYAATRKIRKLENSALANIPIIATTADAFEEDKRKALAAGMNGHIGKPINGEKIIDLIQNVLKNQK